MLSHNTVHFEAGISIAWHTKEKTTTFQWIPLDTFLHIHSCSSRFHPLISVYSKTCVDIIMCTVDVQVQLFHKSLFTVMHCYQYLLNIVETTWGWSFQTTRWTQKRRNTCSRSQAQKCCADYLWRKQSMFAMHSII